MTNLLMTNLLMTQPDALAELGRLARRAQLHGLAAQVDEDALVVFIADESEHRDYILWLAVGDEAAGYEVRTCVDVGSGTTGLTRAWYTPQEWTNRGRGTP